MTDQTPKAAPRKPRARSTAAPTGTTATPATGSDAPAAARAPQRRTATARPRAAAGSSTQTATRRSSLRSSQADLEDLKALDTGDLQSRWALLDSDGEEAEGSSSDDWWSDGGAVREAENEAGDSAGGLELLDDPEESRRLAVPAAVPDTSEIELPKRSRVGFGPITRGLTELGEMTGLAFGIVGDAVRHPRGYWGDVRDQMFSVLKLCWFPMVVSTMAFGLGAPGLQGGNIYNLFGIPDRLGSFFIMASVREFAPFIMAMVVAGVVGTAITADLGARRIRDEIDALEVLGIDPIRTLVLPRVIAVTVMTAILDLLALLCGIIGGFIASVPILGATKGAFVGNFFANADLIDLFGSVVKCGCFGFFIGVVCCYKGLHTKGGPIGVGRSVNQAVVISFAIIWVFNYVFTTTMLGLAPGIQVFK